MSVGAILLLVVVVLVVVAGVGAAVVVLLSRALSARLDRQAAELHTRTLTEREHTTQAMRQAVDTVLLLAGDKLGDHVDRGTAELDLRQQAIDTQVRQMGDELRHLRDLLAKSQQERAQQHGQLVQGITDALAATTELHTTTRELREVLASPKARGQWGERMAEDVLRAAGFQEGVNYRKQTAIAGGGIPDFTFFLPKGMELHMDVKFPIDNYVRHLNATTDADRQATQRAFLSDVRQRVRDLAARGYSHDDGVRGTVLAADSVLLFIPNESIFGFIHQADATVLDDALRRGIVPCSPSTLFGVLAVIRQAVDHFQLERRSDAILQRLGAFNQQWSKFTEHVDRLGKQLDTVGRTYDDLNGVRRRQLEKELARVEELRSGRGLDAAEPLDLEEQAGTEHGSVVHLPSAIGE